MFGGGTQPEGGIVNLTGPLFVRRKNGWVLFLANRMASQVLSFVAVSGHIPLDIFYLAVPVTVMMCGLPGGLSDSVMVAVRVPVSPRAGAKVTWMVQ